MAVTIIRTIIIYISIIIAMRITGKRQIGELEITELVSTILISEIASTPIVEKSSSIIDGIVPVAVIILLEITISFFTTRSDLMKKIFIGSPSVLIRRGELQPKELTKARMTLDELLCQLRENGINTIRDVYYAILESDGKLSVIPKASAKNVTVTDLGLKANEVGIAHAVIIDGTIKKEALEGAGKSEEWLKNQIKKSKLNLEDIFLFSVDDANQTYIVKRRK